MYTRTHGRGKIPSSSQIHGSLF